MNISKISAYNSKGMHKVSVSQFLMKQSSINFGSQENKTEENKIEKDDKKNGELFSQEDIDNFAKELSKLPGEEIINSMEKFISNLYTTMLQETRQRIKVPEGLSHSEENLYKTVYQLVCFQPSALQSGDAEDTSEPVIFSNAFSTKSIDLTMAVIPETAPIFKNGNFLNLFQELNFIENNDIGNTIKSSFQNSREITQRKLLYASTYGVPLVSKEDNILTYKRSPISSVYVELNDDNSLSRIVETYKSSMFTPEKPSIAYEFDEDGYLSKISKYSQKNEVAAELCIDNKKQTVTVFEPNCEPRVMILKKDAFTEV